MGRIVIAIRGAGEMATGVAHRLHRSGFTKIVMTEIEAPLAVRRNVAFSEAIFDGCKVVEGVKAWYIKKLPEIGEVWNQGEIAVVADPEMEFLDHLTVDILVDARMVKRANEPLKGRAPFVVGVGPGFRAPDQVDAVVESNRGHNLGRVIYEGEAEVFTGIPGATGGYTKERVLRSPCAGKVRLVKAIGNTVTKGDLVLFVDDMPVYAQIDGILRGLIRPMTVEADEKVGDIDPRDDQNYCYTISDKARGIAGGVLEAIMAELRKTIEIGE